MNKIKNLTIGCDPELFLVHKDTGKPTSALGIIPGTKECPVDIGKGCALLIDNVMAEFCVPPAKIAGEMHDSIQHALSAIKEKAAKHNLTTSIVPSLTFDDDQLDNPHAQMFGCSPDFDAWREQVNDAPIPTPELKLRSAAGHIHIGYEKSNINTSLALIKLMDLFLGVPSIILDEDKDRRKLYGNAGCFRPKPYGFEYRTLSNFWIDDLDKIEWVFQNIQLAIDMFENDVNISEDDQKNIVKCINSQNSDLANQLVQQFNIPLKKEVYAV